MTFPDFDFIVECLNVKKNGILKNILYALCRSNFLKNNLCFYVTFSEMVKSIISTEFL